MSRFFDPGCRWWKRKPCWSGPSGDRQALVGRAAPIVRLTLCLVVLICGAPRTGAAEPDESPRLNGFDLSAASVPIDRILPGGPPRDGIAALDHPPAVSAGEAGRWPDTARVIGVVRGGEARAYPIRILEWHESVNDSLGGEPILVTYCPLCGTGMVFDRRLDGATRNFGVSGLLYNSDLLLYDRESESLWSQIAARAITGAANGKRLRLLPSSLVPWGVWKEQHPDTTVLTVETGYQRPYDRSVYVSYRRSRKIRFPVEVDERYHPKQPTLGLRIEGGPARAYPIAEVRKAGGSVREEFAGVEVEVLYDPERFEFTARAPEPIEAVQGYWFAWMAFHPESSVFVAPEAPTPEASAPRAPTKE